VLPLISLKPIPTSEGFFISLPPSLSFFPLVRHLQPTCGQRRHGRPWCECVLCGRWSGPEMRSLLTTTPSVLVWIGVVRRDRYPATSRSEVLDVALAIDVGRESPPAAMLRNCTRHDHIRGHTAGRVSWAKLLLLPAVLIGDAWATPQGLPCFSCLLWSSGWTTGLEARWN